MKNKEIKRPNILMHIIIITVSVVLVILLIISTVQIVKTYKEKINLQTNYVLEYATIVDYKSFLSHNGGYYYYTYYEYIAPDGKKYTGIWETNIYDEEKAKSQIGKKVSIYIDNELHLYTKLPKTRPSLGRAYFCGVAAVIFFAVALNSIIRLLRWRRYFLMQVKNDN